MPPQIVHTQTVRRKPFDGAPLPSLWQTEGLLGKGGIGRRPMTDEAAHEGGRTNAPPVYQAHAANSPHRLVSPLPSKQKADPVGVCFPFYSTKIRERHVRVSPGASGFGMPIRVGSALSASTKFVIGSRQMNPSPLE